MAVPAEIHDVDGQVVVRKPAGAGFKGLRVGDKSST